MRAPWNGRAARRNYLIDALGLLSGWSHEGRHIERTLVLDETQHAALTERIKVAADALHLRPEIRRANGRTRIKVCIHDGDAITHGEVTLAARIEDAYRAVTRLP